MTEAIPRPFHDLFGDEEKFLSNPVGEILENHKIKRIPDECRIGNKMLSDVLDDAINGGSAELVADTFPEVAVRGAGGRTYLLTASFSDLAFHIPRYTLHELNSRLFDSELIETLLEGYPKLMSEDWIRPPTKPSTTSLILGSPEDPNPLTKALALIADEFGCQIEEDQESSLWKRYGKSAKPHWSEIAGGLPVCKAPPSAEDSWFANRFLGAIALSGHGLDPDFMEEWGEHLNQNDDLDWVSSRCTVYGQETKRCEGEQTMWLNLEAPIKKDRKVSIQLQGGWTWVGRFKGEGGWKSLTSDDFHPLDHLDSGHIITSTEFRNGQMFERESDEFPGESVTIVGGHGILPSSTVKAISGILEEINFDSDINFVVRADLDDSTVPKKKLKDIREGWGHAPRFIHSRHSPEVHTDQAGKLGGTLWPKATAGWVGASRDAAGDRQSPLNRIMHHHLTGYEKHPEFHPIFIVDMRLQETLQSECILDLQDADQILIRILCDMHGDSETGIRMYFMQAIKEGQSWNLKRHRIATQGTPSDLLKGKWDPEDANLDLFKQDWPTGLVESRSEKLESVLVCDETDLLFQFTGGDVTGISHDDFLLDSIPNDSMPIFRQGLTDLVQTLSTETPDGDTQTLCQILSDNLELMYGTDDEDLGVAEGAMRTDLNEHPPPALGPAFKIFFPEAKLEGRVETNLTRLEGILSDLKGVRKDDVASEIRDVKPDAEEAWRIYNSRKVLLGDSYYRRSNGDIAPSRKQWSAKTVLLSREQAKGLFPNYQTGDNTGWRPPKKRFCVIDRSHGIDFMLEHSGIPRFHISDVSILEAEPTGSENGDDRGNSRWSFVQGLVGLKNSIARGSGEFTLPPLNEKEEYDKCNIFSFGSKPLRIGQHGWDLDRGGGLAVLTDSPETASIRQKNGLRYFLTELLGITRADLQGIRIDKDATDATERESLALLLGTDLDTLGVLMDSMHHSTSADFLNPFNDPQSGDWWQRHGTKVDWIPGIERSLTRRGAKQLHKEYQESLLKLLRNPSPADEVQERCIRLRIRERYDVDNEFERELYRGIHSMIAEEPRIYVKADGASAKMHVGRIESDSERQEALGNLDLFPGNVLFLSPFSANRLKMTAQDGGIRVRAGVRFGKVFQDLLKSWDKLDEIVTIKDIFEFNDESDDTSMSMKVHKFHLALIAALDDALSEYTSEMP